MRIEVLTRESVEEISELLVGRHKRERKVFEGLKAEFEDLAIVKPLIEKLFDEDIVIAIGAYENSKLIGYIVSQVMKSDVFGRCAWVKYEGTALAENSEPEVYRELYCHIADLWLKAGCLKHYVIVPAGDQEVTKAWLHSGFAYEQVFGMNKLTKQSLVENKSAGDIRIRKAEGSDADVLKSVSGIILSHQAKSPTFAAALPELFGAIEKGYAGLASDDSAHVLLAYKGEELLGFTCGYFDEDSNQNMMLPHKGMELGVAATIPSKHKMGAGTLLTKHLFNNAISAGYEYSMTDWRITNLTSSKFWPKMGYKPYAYRMIRNIDPRAYWANGESKI